jgi:hypothetical protein
VNRADWPTTFEHKDLAIAEATTVIFGPDTRCGEQSIHLVLVPVIGQ